MSEETRVNGHATSPQHDTGPQHDGGDLQGDTGALPVIVLTDEELGILTTGETMAVSPFASTMADVERKVAARTAYRGLLARGIVDPPTPEAVAAWLDQGGDPETRTVELMVREDVRSLVTIRQNARMVVAAARTSASSQDFWYAHTVDDVTVLEEVSGDGLHRFALLRTSELPGVVLDAVLHPESADAEGEPVSMPAITGLDPTPPTEVVESLGAAMVRCDLVVRHVDDEEPPLVGLFTGPGGAWSVTAHRGARETLEVLPRRLHELKAEIVDLVETATKAAAVGAP
jgi:hypothetical protein